MIKGYDVESTHKLKVTHDNMQSDAVKWRAFCTSINPKNDVKMQCNNIEFKKICMNYVNS